MSNPLPVRTRTYRNHHLDSTRWDLFKPRVDDIVISTSYKSGTTWTQGIVLQLIFQGQAVPSREDTSRWLDRRLTPLDELLAQLESQTHRRVIKSHLALDGLLFYPYIKYLIVSRDARDVGMSLWNHYSNYTETFYERLNQTPGRVGAPMPHSPPDIHEFWRNWISRGWFPWESEGYPFWGNMHHTQTWWDYRHLDNILFVHYADLLADVNGEIRRIAKFLEIPVTDASVQTIASRVTLSAMRDEELKTEGSDSSFKGGANTFFFRGTNGRWKDTLDAGELALYDQAVARVLTPDCAAWLENGHIRQRQLHQV